MMPHKLGFAEDFDSGLQQTPVLCAVSALVMKTARHQVLHVPFS